MFKNIFKKVFEIIFNFIYGKISGVTNSKNNNSVRILEIFRNKIIYKIFIISGGRMYTDTINDAAFIVDNKIIDGPSYQLRPNKNDKLSPRNNSHCEENIVLKKGTPRIIKKVKGNVLSLLSGGGANDNYFHWLYDVLPRLSLIDETNYKGAVNYILVPNYMHQFQKRSLNLLGFKEEQILSSKKIRHLSSNKILVTDHPYNINNDTEIDHSQIPSWISHWLKEKFLKENFSNLLKYNRIYIDRDDVDPKRNSERRILNENKLRNFLSQLNFKFIKLNEIDFLDQVKIFYNAEIILGLHGAGFANISFCKPGTKIIEIRSKHTGKILENIAKNNKLNFNCLEYEPKELSDKQNGLIEVSIDQVKKIIKV